MLLMIKNKINSITTRHQRVMVKDISREISYGISTFKCCIRYGLKPVISARVYISHKYRFINFQIQKVASTTQTQLVCNLHEVSEDTMETKELIRTDFLQYTLYSSKYKYDDYYKWVFARNPWDRLLSCYRNKIIDNRPILNSPPFPVLCPDGLNEKNAYKFNSMTFEDFVKFVYKTPDFLCDGHFLPQHYFISHKMDFIGHFENFDADMLKLLSIVAPDCSIKEVGKENISSNRGGKPYREYYTDEMREMVARKYARDIELFDYQF